MFPSQREGKAGDSALLSSCYYANAKKRGLLVPKNIKKKKRRKSSGWIKTRGPTVELKRLGRSQLLTPSLLLLPGPPHTLSAAGGGGKKKGG